SGGDRVEVCRLGDGEGVARHGRQLLRRSRPQPRRDRPRSARAGRYRHPSVDLPMAPRSDQLTYVHGAMIRGPLDRRALALCYTGHEFGESLPEILIALATHHAKASFFFTGDFLRN